MPPGRGRVAQVSAAAGRIRMLQQELSQASSEERRSAIARTIRVERDKLPDSQREAFLRELARQFPTWSSAPASRDDRGPMNVYQSFTEFETSLPAENWRYHLRRLEELAGNQMTDEDLVAIRDRLRRRGLLESDPSEQVEVPRESVHKAAGIGADEHVDVVRLLRLTALLRKEIAAAELPVRTAWSQVANSPKYLRRDTENELANLFAGYLSGDPDITDEQIETQVGEVMLLMTVLAASIRTATRNWAYQHSRQFSPEAIKQLSGAGGFGRKEAAYWRYYEEMASTLQQTDFEDQLRLEFEKHITAILDANPKWTDR